jgi:hypothetical protein
MGRERRSRGDQAADSRPSSAPHIFRPCPGVSLVKKLLRPAKLRTWRISIIRKRGQYLGTVEAPDEKAAEAAAVAEFDLSVEQRRRLVVSERD